MSEQDSVSASKDAHDVAAEKALETVLLEQAVYEELMLVHIAEHRFLIRVNEAEEVVRSQKLTSVPMAPNHLLGVCNVHGLVVCIVDPIKVLNLKTTANSDTPLELQRYVVYKHPRMKAGLKVDAVSQVFQVRQDALPEKNTEAISAKVTVGDESYPVLDLNVMFQ